MYMLPKKYIDVKMLRNNALNIVLLVNGVQYGGYFSISELKKMSENDDYSDGSAVFNGAVDALKKLEKIPYKNKKEKKLLKDLRV